jgi:hypothetical protein
MKQFIVAAAILSAASLPALAQNQGGNRKVITPHLARLWVLDL